MDATDRIVDEFNRLVEMGRDRVASRPLAERIVYYIVATRCEIDIDGFESVYEQDLDPAELGILIEGLRQIEESDLAAEFQRGYELLAANGFYDHLNWSIVSSSVQSEIVDIGARVGDRMWELDEKLALLLDDAEFNHRE